MDNLTPGFSEGEISAENMTEALISIDNLTRNVSIIREKLSGRARIMGIVKANAYGHNVHKVAGALEASGVEDFGVANIHEAIELKSGGALKKSPRILAFAPPLISHIDFFLKYGIEMTVCDMVTLKAVMEIASAHNKTVAVQLKVDTGMGRLGMSPQAAMEILREIDQTPLIDLKGIYTHFADSTSTDGFTGQQLSAFNSLTAEYEHFSGRIVCKHAANSGAILSLKESWLDMVRPGILLYGYHPTKNTDYHLDVKPVMQFEAKVIFIKTVPAGTSVSYKRTWTSPGSRDIATIAVGYADGYSRALSNRACVMINGRIYQQVGTVTMDQIMVDLGTQHDVKKGDKAILFGWNGPTANDIAEIDNTISYETLCSVSSRVKRIFV